jgi:predicted transcriptional regulator of viral defense system
MSINKIPEELLVKQKTEAGYLNVSNPALTATDLVQFEKRTGGFNRVSTVLNELANNIKSSDFNEALFNHVPATAFQRLGYLLEFVCNRQNLADALFKKMEDHKLKFFRIPLKASKTSKGFSSANRWNVIVNTEIEIDE